MEFRDWFIILTTFLVGMLSGMYLYTTSFAPTYEDRDIFSEIDEVPAVEFDVIGLQYGGLVSPDYEYPYYEVDDSGEYRYSAGGIDPTDQDGILPEVLLRELNESIARADLEEFSTVLETGTCVPDESAYEYSIVRKGSEYTLNTCSTEFSHESPLGSVLLKMWQYMNAPEAHRVSVSNSTDNAVDDGTVDIGEEAQEKKRIILNPIEFLRQGMEDSFGKGE